MMKPGRLIRNTRHDRDAGILGTYTNALTGNFVCLYDGAEQGLDTDGGKYTLVCQCHTMTLSHNNRAHAMWMARNPTEWCEGCVEAADELQNLVQQIKASAQ